MINILVATDFSEGSNNAIQFARSIAKIFQSKLIYFHAHYPVVPTNYLDPNGIYLSMPENDLKEVIISLNHSLDSYVKEDAKQGIQSDVVVEVGDITSVIHSLQEKRSIDLVIISKTSNTNFLEKLLGSTAKTLLHNLDVPLLIIPSNYKGQIFQKVLYASQLEFDEIPFIKMANEWAKKSAHKLTFVHLDEEFETDLIPNHQYVKEIKEAFQNDPFIFVNADTKSFKKGLLKLIKEQKASLICMTTHKRNLLTQIISPSKTREAIEYIPIPTLVFNAKN
jgi:nucleotide-binding universal stress UspA family protein